MPSVKLTGFAACLLLAACGDSTGGDGGAAPASTGQPSAATSEDPPATSAATSSTPTEEPATSGPGETDEPPETTDAADSSGGDDGPMPSAGCGNARPPNGSLQMQVQGQTGEYIVSLPPDYDPQAPYPLGFAFHGRNRTGPNCMGGDCAGFQSTMSNDAVLVYMTSMGGTGWEGQGERELNVEFFELVLEQITSETCIDESTMFSAGTSSGAHFTNILGCRFGDRLIAISPVAGVLPEGDGCVGRSAALVIHGYADPHVVPENGATARDFWRERNGCSTETDVPISEVHDSVANNPETHACATYLDCDPGLPVVWCEHSEGGYDGSTHGWPLFAGEAIWDFVQAL